MATLATRASEHSAGVGKASYSLPWTGRLASRWPSSSHSEVWLTALQHQGAPDTASDLLLQCAATSAITLIQPPSHSTIPQYRPNTASCHAAVVLFRLLLMSMPELKGTCMSLISPPPSSSLA